MSSIATSDVGGLNKKRLRYTKKLKWHGRFSRTSSMHDDDLDHYMGWFQDPCQDDTLDSVHEGTSEPESPLSPRKRSQSFQVEVERKSRMFMIGESEAEVEVAVDVLIEEHGGKDDALLAAVTDGLSENKVQTIVMLLLYRGARPTAVDNQGRTALHHAVKRNYEGVCQRLLEHNASPNKRDCEDFTPYHIALENQNDEIASILLVYMPNQAARDMYSCHGSKPAEMSFQKLLLSPMQKTVLSLLDCMIDECTATSLYRVHYSILEADEEGRPPNHPGFDNSSSSSLHIIAQTNNKAVVYHDVIRLLIRQKWKDFAKWRFQLNAFIYIVSLVALTFSVITACASPDPRHYSAPLDISRAVCESIVVGYALLTLLVELNQMRKHRMDHWKDPFNVIDLWSACLLLIVLPLRYLNYSEQWPVYSFGFLFWTLRIFKYAAVFRQTGAYAQILWKILTQDFPQFTLVFAIILVAFSGSFILALKGEGTLDKHTETSSFWWITFTGARTLIEAQPVIEYAGEEGGFRTLGVGLMVVFLFACIVVLLNILIAQLSDTYQNIQGDAQRGLELNRAWIVTRVERNSVFIGKGYRESRYRAFEELVDLVDVLRRWENAPLNDHKKMGRDIQDRMDVQDLNIRTVKTRLARQGHALASLREQLQEVIMLLLKIQNDNDLTNMNNSMPEQDSCKHDSMFQNVTFEKPYDSSSVTSQGSGKICHDEPSQHSNDRSSHVSDNDHTADLSADDIIIERSGVLPEQIEMSDTANLT